MGQILPFGRQTVEPVDKNMIFAYDLKSISKHFIVGTSVIDHVDDLVRYDDYPIIRQKKGLQVKSLGFYRDQEKVVGYEIVYNDAQNNTTTLRRLAPYFRTFGHKAYKEQKVLHYNEHLADIDIIHTQNEIEFIDILTTKGRHIKVFEEKVGDDERCTSFNKIDVTQKNYAPIIAFETTFSKDRLKELFVYRSPVRISKRRKQKNLTVNELNHLKAAPNLSTTLRTQQNLNLWRSLTRKEIIQKASVVRSWVNITAAQKSKIISSEATLETPSVRLDTLADQQRSREAFMEEQEYGVDDDDDEDKEDDKKDKKSPPRKRSIFGLLPFGQRKSVTNSPDKGSKDKEGGFESQIKNFFFGKKGSSSSNTSQRNSRRASVGVALYKDPEKIAKFEAAYKERENKKNEKNEQMDFTLNTKARSPRDLQYLDRSDSPPKSPERRDKKSKTTVNTPKINQAHPHPHPPMWKKMSENVRSKLKAFAIFNEKDDRKRVDNSNHENDENLKTEQSPITYELEADDEINYKSHNKNHRVINFASNSNSNSGSESNSNSNSPSQSPRSQSKSHSCTNSHSGSAKGK